MRHIIPLALLCTLSGCCWFSWGSDDEPATLPPSKPGKATPVDAYADAADRVFDVAAAAVATAQQANKDGKPEVVDGELGVAANALPRPSPQELKAARSRAEANSPKVYAEAITAADRMQRELDTLWATVEAEKEKARQQNEARQQELDAARAAQRDLIWTVAGLAILVAGLAAAVWGSAFGVTKVEAGLIMACGVGVGSLPWALESDLSVWVVAPVGGLIALRLVVWVWSAGWKGKGNA